jgi:hypothetical protein
LKNEGTQREWGSNFSFPFFEQGTGKRNFQLTAAPVVGKSPRRRCALSRYIDM